MDIQLSCITLKDFIMYKEKEVLIALSAFEKNNKLVISSQFVPTGLWVSENLSELKKNKIIDAVFGKIN